MAVVPTARQTCDEPKDLLPFAVLDQTTLCGPQAASVELTYADSANFERAAVSHPDRTSPPLKLAAVASTARTRGLSFGAAVDSTDRSLGQRKA